VASARIALTSTGPAPQPGPVATAQPPADASGVLSAFEALLSDSQQRIAAGDADGASPETDLQAHAGPEHPLAGDFPPGAARAAQAAWLATEHFEPAVAHAVRRGSIRGRGVGDAGDDDSPDARETVEPSPDDVVALLVPTMTPTATQPPQATDVPVATAFELPPLPSVAAAPAGRWREGQVPDGIVLPPPVPADVGPEAAAGTTDRSAVVPPVVVRESVPATDPGQVAAAVPGPPASGPQTRGDGGPSRTLMEQASLHAMPPKGARPTEAAEPPPADQYSRPPGKALASTSPAEAPDPASPGRPGAAPDDVRDATVTRADVAAIARTVRGGSNGAPSDGDARGADPERPRGLDRAVAAKGSRQAIVPALLATEPAARAALVSQAPEAAATAPAGLPDTDSLASQIVQRMRLQWTAGAGTAVVTLDPEYLGAVTINLHVDGSGAMTATLSADNADVRAWMQAHEPALRQQLAEQGLSLDRLQVSDEHPREDEAPADERRRRWQPPAPPPPKRTASGTFAVVV
jgi:hypothetical protein